MLRLLLDLNPTNQGESCMLLEYTKFPDAFFVILHPPSPIDHDVHLLQITSFVD
jgi:hypothetical protein